MKKTTHCKLGHACETEFEAPKPPCQEFQRQKGRKFPVFYPQHFVLVGDDKVRCPHCGGYNTVRRPTLRKMTVCRKCHILLKQAGKGRYHGRTDVDINRLKEYFGERLFDWSGRPFITISKNPHPIHLRTGEALTVEDPEEIGISLVRVHGRKAPAPFRSGGDTLFIEEVSEITLAGGRIESGREILEKHGIDIAELSEEEIIEDIKREEREIELRQALRELRGDISLKKAAEAVIARILSNLNYTYTLGQLNPKKKLPLILRQFDQIVHIYILLRKITSSKGAAEEDIRNFMEYMNHLRSREGIADNAAWEMIITLLAERYQFASRKFGRLVLSTLHYGSKGMDPFNCALNYLYYLLRWKAREALEAAGFHKYFPGIGFLHRRHKEPPVIEHENNSALIYDFMDPYRAPFRHYLLLAFPWQKQKEPFKDQLLHLTDDLAKWLQNKKNTVSMQDFKTPQDKWHPIYQLNKDGRDRLKYLFNLIWEHPFPNRGQKVPLREIMRDEADSFAKFLLREREKQKHRLKNPLVPCLISFFWQFLIKPSHRIFSIMDGTKTTDFFLNLKWMLNPTKLKPLLVNERARQVGLLVSLFFYPLFFRQKPIPVKRISPTQFRNVIIITHTDADGFLSGLHLFTKYYHWNAPSKGTVQILTTTNEKCQQFLDEQIPNLLWRERDAHNIIIIADLHILEDRAFLRNLRHKFLRIFRGRTEQLEVIWYDHHPLDSSINLDEFQKEYGIEFHHLPSSKDAYRIIREELQEELMQHTRYSDLLRNPVAQIGIIFLSLFLQLLRIGRYQKKSYRNNKLEAFNQEFLEIGAFFWQLFKIAYYGKKLSLTKWRKRLNNETSMKRLRNFSNFLKFEKNLNEKLPWKLYQQLKDTDNQILQKEGDPTFLEKWIRWFKAIHGDKRKLRHQNWFNFFKDVLKEKHPPEIPSLLEKDPEQIFHYVKVHGTANQVPFLALAPKEPQNITDIKEYIAVQMRSIPKFLVIFLIWDCSVSVRASQYGAMDFSAIAAEYGGAGHPGAIRILRPRQKAYCVENGFLCRLLDFKKLLALLHHVELSQELMDLPPREIPDIPRNNPLPWDPQFNLMEYLDEVYPYYSPVPEEPPKERNLTLDIPDGPPLQLPPGKVVLLYSSVKEREHNALRQVLHQLMHTYLQQNPIDIEADTDEILFLEANTPRAHFDRKRLYELGTSPALMAKVLYYPELDYPTLRTFILRYLLSTIRTRGTQLVVLTLPFRLIQKHFQTNDRLSAIMSQKGSELAAMLRYIARITGTRILITSNSTYKDTKNPYLHVNTRAILRFWVRTVQVDENYELTVRDRGGSEDNQYELTLPIPPKKKATEVLANACNLPAEIDWTFPESLSTPTEEIDWEEVPAGEELEAKPDWDEWDEWIHEEEEAIEAEEEGSFESPTLRTTIYGMKFLVWRFWKGMGYLKNVDEILASDAQERSLDLIRWPSGNYSIRNSDADLWVLVNPKSPFKGERRQQGRGAFFNSESGGAFPFEIFVQLMPYLFLEVQQLHVYLKEIRDELAPPEGVMNQEEPKEASSETGIERFCDALLLILYPFPPSRPWRVTERWENIITDLQLYFTWAQIERITNQVFENLAKFEIITELDVTRKSIKDGLRQGLRAREAELSLYETEVEPTPIPDEGQYLAKYPQLVSIESVGHPRIPNLTILLFQFDAWISWWKDVPDLRASVNFPRALDICLFVDGTYHVFSNIGNEFNEFDMPQWIDLRTLESLGGTGSGTRMKFEPKKISTARKFKSFLEEIFSLDYIGFHQYIAFLSRKKDEFGVREGKSVEGDVSAYDEAVRKSLHEKVFKILYPFPPPEPHEIAQRWTDCLRELQVYFNWKQVYEITNLILEPLRVLRNESDEVALHFAVKDGLGKGNDYKSLKK